MNTALQDLLSHISNNQEIFDHRLRYALNMGDDVSDDAAIEAAAKHHSLMLKYGRALFDIMYELTGDIELSPEELVQEVKRIKAVYDINPAAK